MDWRADVGCSVGWWVGGGELVIWRAFRLLVWWTGVGSVGR